LNKRITIDNCHACAGACGWLEIRINGKDYDDLEYTKRMKKIPLLMILCVIVLKDKLDCNLNDTLHLIASPQKRKKK
jgi:hypothetical protein